jgi:hypothetical protein
VPRRGLEPEHKRLILKGDFVARANLPTETPTMEATLAWAFRLNLQWSKFPVLRRLKPWSPPHRNGGSSVATALATPNIERRWLELAWRPSPHHAWLAYQLRLAAATARTGKLSKRSDRSWPIRPERSVRSL